MSDKDIKLEGDIKIHSLPSVFVLKAKLHNETIKKLDGYLDKLKVDKNRESNAEFLVGQIKKGQQLLIDPTHKNVTDYNLALCSLANYYVKYFYQYLGKEYIKRAPQIDKIWSVHSFGGDYNPMHSHMCKTMTGISAVTWTKVPKCISDKSSKNEGLANASGSQDGHLGFFYGTSTLLDAELLKPVQDMTVKPRIGDIYMFPSWLQHMVYPFDGEGERTTISANINMWPPKDNEIKLG